VVGSIYLVDGTLQCLDLVNKGAHVLIIVFAVNLVDWASQVEQFFTQGLNGVVMVAELDRVVNWASQLLDFD